MRKRYSNKLKFFLTLILGVVILFFAFVKLPVASKGFAQTTTSLLPSILKDSETGLSLSIQLTDGQADTGEFDFFVPEKGFYHGVIPLLRSGQDIVHSQGIVNAQFYRLDNSLPTATKIKMEGEINKNTLTATLNVWIDKSKYHLLVQQADSSSVTSTAKRAANTIVSQDWSSLYGQLSSEVQNTMTEQQFDDYMTSNSSVNIIAAGLDGIGQTSNVSGDTYDKQPVILTVQNPNGSISTFHSNMFFIWENNSWKLLSTDTPQ